MISPLQYQEMVARTLRNKIRESSQEFTPCEKEVGSGGLHEQIEAECRHRLWPYIHSRTDRKSTTESGVPDFVIAADHGRTFFIECKSKTGKQTTEQRGFQMLLERNGHTYHLVRSFEEFLNLIKTYEK